MPKKLKDDFNKYKQGVTNEDLDEKLDLILEHITGVTDKNVENLQQDMKEVKSRLKKIEVQLVAQHA